jgi:hypothetical protein
MSNIKRLIEERDDLRTEVEVQKAYIKYLREWYRTHTTPMEEAPEPMSYEEFCSKKHTTIYVVKVTINESSHVIQSFIDTIEVKGPSGMHMGELKEYLIWDTAFSIEDYVNPKVDTPDAVNIEIHDFDIELIEIKNKEV